MKNLASKSDFGLFLAKMSWNTEKLHKEPRKTSLRAHIAISNGFPDFQTPRKHRSEKSSFSRFSSQKSIFQLCVHVNNRNPDFQAHENSNKTAFCVSIRAANVSYDYRTARTDRIKNSLFFEIFKPKIEKKISLTFALFSHLSHRSQLEAVC